MIVDPRSAKVVSASQDGGTSYALVAGKFGEAQIHAGSRVLLRQPSFVFESVESAVETKYAGDCLKSAWATVLGVDAEWMNPWAAVRSLGGDKVGQQVIAARSGLRTIPTTLTNDPSTFIAAVESTETDAVAIKSPVSWHSPLANTGPIYATYTRRLSKKAAISLARHVEPAPLLVQPYIEKSFEVRATIIAGSCYACRIDNQGSERAAVDWRRYDFSNVRHSVFELPADLVESLSRFMTECRFVFAGIDLIFDREHRPWFVEANPSGQYGWIEGLTGLPISAAIAEWLLGDSVRSPHGPTTEAS